MHMAAVHTAAGHVLAGNAPPLFNGVLPSLGPLAGAVGTKVAVALGIVWFLAFAYAAWHLVEGLARVSNAKRSDVQEAMVGARRDLLFASSGLVALVALPAIYGALTA